TIGKAVEIVQRHSRIGPYLLQAAAEHAPLVIEIFQQMPRPGEDRTRSGVEIFVERHIDGVEQCRAGRGRDPRVGRSEEQARAVEVQSDPPLAGECGNLLISAKSKTSPMMRRTGDSIEIAP